MSLFISQENQNLLYDMIHKTPEIHTVFSTLDSKNEWFRGIIERHYRQMPKTINRDELKNINRQVLGYMVGSLRALSMNPQPPTMTTNTQVMPTNLLKREQKLEPPAYMPVFDNPKPTPIDFSEKLEDDVITNMDELIEQQRRLRERDLQEYTPPNPVSQDTPKIMISHDLPKEVLQPIEKRVQFDLPLITEIEKMKDKMENIENKLDDTMKMLRTFIQSATRPPKTHLPTENPVVVLKNIIATSTPASEYNEPPAETI